MTESSELRSGLRRERILARSAIIFLGLSIVIDLAFAAVQIRGIFLMERLGRGDRRVREIIPAADALYLFITMVLMVFIVPCAVLFLMWFHRAYRNLRLTGSHQTDHAIWWAAGGFFVPILNLVRPFQIAKELRLRSSNGNKGASKGPYARAPWTVRIWWGAFVLAAVVAAVGIALVRDEMTFEAIVKQARLYTAASLLHALAGAFAIALVFFTHGAQAFFGEAQPDVAAQNLGSG